MNNFYISFNAAQDYTAWYKATVDVEYFLNDIGFTPIPIKFCIENMRNCLKTYINKENELVDNGIIFVQYPRVIIEGLNLDKFIKLIRLNYKSYRIVALVHDLDSVRFGKFITTNYISEVPTLNKFDYVITVNEAMSALLKSHGVISKLYSLTIFDYVLAGTNNNEIKYNPANVSIAYSGNLKFSKSAFVYRLHKVNFGNVIINLYGPGININKTFLSRNINVKYKGAFSADDLAHEIKEDFGLCWDGDCLDRCGGLIGQYLRYTNPHKASLYLALGIPVIISKDISTAEFIKREHVGLTINKLQDIPNTINKISVDEYKIMKENAHRISEKLRNGYYIKNAINNIEKHIESQI